MIKISTYRILIKILFVLNLSALLACQQQSDKQEESVANTNLERKLSLSIVHDNDLKLEEWLKATTDQYTNNSSNKNLNINLISKSISAAVEQIADGRIKTDAVILPHRSFSSLINTKVINLGATVSNCKDMISSSYVAVIPNAYLQKLSEILGRDFTSLASNNGELNKINVSMAEFYKILRNSRFGFVNPARSARGSFAFLMTVASSAPAFFEKNNSPADSLTWDSALAATSQLKENFEWYAPTDSLILKRLTSQNSSLVHDLYIPLGIMSERQLNFNSNSNNPLTIIKLSDYQLQENHSLCISDAAWVTDKKRLILSDLQQFLVSESSLELATKSGFVAANGNPATNIHNIQIENPEISLAQGLAEFFEKKKAISIAIDTSASMSDKDLNLAKNFAVKLLNRNATNKTELLTFSSDIIYWNERLKDLNAIKDALLKIEPSGGSSIYDSIIRQYRGLEKFDKNEFAKFLIIITDGGDINSFRKLQDVISLVNSNISAGSSQKSGFTSLHIVAINNGSGELDSLKAISEAAVGNFYEVTSESLPTLLTELEGLLL